MLKKLIHHTKIAVLACIFAAPLTATTAQPITEPLAKQSAANTEKAVNKTAKADVAKKTIHLNRKEILTHLNALSKNMPYMPGSIAKKLHRISNGGKLSDDALTELISSVLKLAYPKPTDSQETTEHYKALKAIEDLLIKRLKSYRISGVSWAVDLNGAFFVDNQDPSFAVTYCNAKGEVKNRTYQASIDLIGLNIEFGCRFNLFFFTNTDANFYNTNKTIDLGHGVEIGGALLCGALGALTAPIYAGEALINHQALLHLIILLQNMRLTYIPFNNAPGGLIILTFTLGPNFAIASIVTGGTLTPID